jgi:hypothetical protein
MRTVGAMGLRALVWIITSAVAYKNLNLPIHDLKSEGVV